MEKLFDAIGMEDQKPAEVVAAPLAIEDVITQEDAEATLVASKESLDAGIRMVDNALEVAASMEQTISAEQAILDADGATAGIAQLAMMNLQSSATMLGMEAADFAISAESMEQNPGTALKVSVESAKDTLKNIMKKIQDFFKKLWQKFRGVVAKAVVAISAYDKKFTALSASAAKAKVAKEGDAGKYSEGEAKAIAKKFFVELSANGGKLKAEQKISPVLTAGPGLLTTLTDAVTSDKSVADLEKAFNKVEAAEYKDNFDGVTDGTFALVSRADGMTVSGMSIKFEEVKFGDATKTKISTAAVKFSGKKDKVASFSKDLPLLSASDISTYIDRGSKMASEIKKYSEEVSKSVDSVQKLFTEKGFGVEGDAAKQANSVYSTMVSSLSTNALKFGTDSIFGYLGEMKNIAYLASVSISKYEGAKPAAKDENEGDDK